MESQAICNSSSALNLTLATPSHENGPKPSSDGSMANATVSNIGQACSRELALLDYTINPPSHDGGEDAMQIGGNDDDDVEVVEDGAGGEPSFLPRRKYTRYYQEQQDLLEAAYQENNYPDKSTKEALADRLNLTLKQVQVWFVNRRSRLKNQQITVEGNKKPMCDDYKHQINSLTKEKCRLKRKIDKLKEVNKKLKATLMAPPPPPTPVLLQLLPLPGAFNTIAKMFPNVKGNVTTTIDSVAAAIAQQDGATASASALAATSTPTPPPPSSSSVDA